MKGKTDTKPSLKNTRYSDFLLPLVIVFAYLLFPNNNPVTDAWEYAANIKLAEDLLRPHHLLYNPFMLLITKCVRLLGEFDILRIMQLTNSVFALLSLWVLVLLLRKFEISKSSVTAWILFAAGSFALLRYGTENETYIVPIFFSLLASLYYKSFLERSCDICTIALSSLFASLACLFHQVQIFWFLGILIALLLNRKYKAFLVYVSVALIIPLGYTIAMIIKEGSIGGAENLMGFTMSYYYSHNDGLSIGLNNVLLTPISLVRSFFQVHGNIVGFYLYKPLLSSLILLIIIFLAILSLNRASGLKIKKHRVDNFTKTHFMILLMQIIFAFVSDGNAEFMVMIPVLCVIILARIISINTEAVKYFAGLMLIWNLYFAILPNHYYDFFGNKQIVEIIDQNPDSGFILEEATKIEACYRYLKGHDISERVLTKQEDCTGTYSGLYFTDLLSKKMPISRSTLLSSGNKHNYQFISHFAEIECFYGIYYIDRIRITEKSETLK